MDTQARRYHVLELLSARPDGLSLSELASETGADERTIRRDVVALQDLLSRVSGLELLRGVVVPRSAERAAGYFADHLDTERRQKEAIAREVVQQLPEDAAIALTAGSTAYFVAKEIKRRVIEDGGLRNLVAFTNGLAALLELASAGISTGVLGEVYHPGDGAFHSHTAVNAYQAGILVVGASGVTLGPSIELSSHRAEEAAFLQQLVLAAPECWIVVDSTKIGRKHPWPFANASGLEGKTVRLFTGPLNPSIRGDLGRVRERFTKAGGQFELIECAD